MESVVTQSTATKPKRHRNHLMDIMRIVFAACVLLSHAPELIDGDKSREIFYRLTHAMTFGDFGVDGFFLISGFLIVKSWQTTPDLSDYLYKRVLRIVPGYLVAVLLSTLILGLIAPAVPRFFAHLGIRFLASVLLLSAPITPGVCPGSHLPIANGSLWTIAYEFRCYIMVALFGICGLLRRPFLWLAVTMFLLCASMSPSLQKLLFWHGFYLLTGDPPQVYRLTSIFCIGGCFYLFRKNIPFRPLLALAAAVAVGLALLEPWLFEKVLTVCGGYILFYLTSLHIRFPKQFDRFPDISYGLYLYGWPIQMLWIWHFHGSPWTTFAGTLVLSAAAGWLSWHYIERPMLKLKPGPSVPLTG